MSFRPTRRNPHKQQCRQLKHPNIIRIIKISGSSDPSVAYGASSPYAGEPLVKENSGYFIRGSFD